MINSLLLSIQAKKHFSLLEKCAAPIGFRFTTLENLLTRDAIFQFIRANSIKLIVIELPFPDMDIISLIRDLEKVYCQSLLIFSEKEAFGPLMEVGVIGCTVCPITSESLHRAFRYVLKRIYTDYAQSINKVNSTEELLGIPTFKGYDFFKIRDILRCEGLQRCTRIIIRGNKSLTSSHNLGNFSEKLEPYGFFSPHKSHLINLNYIQSYERAGNIIMQDGADIPVARRKRQALLAHLNRL